MERELFRETDAEEGSSKRLWCAVLLRAIQDATDVPPPRPNRYFVRDQEQARNWLINPNQDFHHVCQLAGFDPQAVRERAAKLIGMADRNELPIPGRKRQGWGATQRLLASVGTGVGSVARGGSEIRNFADVS